MFKVIGKILIFVFSIILIAFGVSGLVYLFIDYIHLFDTTHTVIAIIQSVLSLLTGIFGVICVSLSKSVKFLSIPSFILLGLSIYYFVIFKNSTTAGYYLALGIINLISSVSLLASIYWNRGR